MSRPYIAIADQYAAMETEMLPIYFGVIGNRDQIKIRKGTTREEKRPFWEFLDAQPGGWLCSLAYERDTFPEERGPMIWDCGAWSYKAEPVPKLGRHLVTAAWALEQYMRLGREKDFVVAPDHMLSVPTEADARRMFNRQSAEEFFAPAHDAGFRPMAVVHGETVEERIRYAEELAELGYDALSLGGLAFQASARRETIIGIVREIRRRNLGVWLHVLGLSSPSFVAAWTEMEVDSCDGASHFKQAFTGGAFFTEEKGKLTKHRAARPGQAVEAPSCDCTACERLRSEGIDTRTYGSNENNMGRAAHNMNMLMRAHKWARKSVTSSWSRVSQLNLLGDRI